jgi:tetratricopeptide (TPR) repeat protein
MKKLSFWIITTIGLPILFLLLIELSLVLIGYGHPSDYFLTRTDDGKDYLQTNGKFRLQFFPSKVSLSQPETTISRDKDDSTVRIFVLGGSAAQGFPDPDFGFSPLLERILQIQYPILSFEVVNTAMIAINSHVVYEIAKSVSDQQGDIAILLMGNNEVVGPYGPGTVFQSFNKNIFMIRASLAVKRSRTGQLISNTVASFRPGDEKLPDWKGMETFIENRVRRDDVRLASVYKHFRKNMEDTIELLLDSGKTVVVSTVPVNLRDTAPFASMHDPDLGENDLERWESLYSEGINYADSGRCGQAIRNFREAEGIDASFADLHYRLAHCYRDINDLSAASERFRKARDFDSLRFRADGEINGLIREVAAGYAGQRVRLADLEQKFEAATHPDLPGQDLFYEHVHLNFAGHYLIAAGFAEIINRILPAKPVRPIPSGEQVADLVDYPDRQTWFVLNRIVDMLQYPPFSYEINQREQIQRIKSDMEALQSYLKEDRGSSKRRWPVFPD